MAYLAIKLKQARDFPIACKIVLLPERRYYVPGDIVEGKLIVSHRQKAEVALRSIKVTLQGSSLAKFKEREQIHHKTETFLDQGVIVFGARDRDVRALSSTHKLPAGTHSYGFQLQVPTTPQIPSTFKTAIGLVIYQVLAILDIGTQYLKKGEKTIDVRGALEIGPEPPIEYEKVERRFGGDSKPCPKFSFKVPTSGFVIGRDIEFDMLAINYRAATETKEAPTRLQGIVSLVLKTTYYGGTVSRAWKDTFAVVSEVVNDDVGGCWRGSLPVGRQLLASFTGGVVEFRYLLRVSLESNSKEGILFKFEKPVKIGTSAVGEAANASVDANTLDEKLGGLAIGGEREQGAGGASFTAAAAGGCRVPFDLESLDERPGTSGSLPSYSTLSLRAGSFETLPPEYDELQHEHRHDSD